eukprot:TRINITY_DN13721_c0_g1_i1.p2 TRINITY_DN13721_c0_g1~~TRINITY_DN13721_c0_g1_i1.p2  ORF type:complete len:449 (+),score=91.45 TRINITY_DN13721_c0_g1_i1:97-1347(+)
MAAEAFSSAGYELLWDGGEGRWRLLRPAAPLLVLPLLLDIGDERSLALPHLSRLAGRPAAPLRTPPAAPRRAPQGQHSPTSSAESAEWAAPAVPDWAAHEASAQIEDAAARRGRARLQQLRRASAERAKTQRITAELRSSAGAAAEGSLGDLPGAGAGGSCEPLPGPSLPPSGRSEPPQPRLSTRRGPVRAEAAGRECIESAEGAARRKLLCTAPRLRREAASAAAARRQQEAAPSEPSSSGEAQLLYAEADRVLPVAHCHAGFPSARLGAAADALHALLRCPRVAPAAEVLAELCSLRSRWEWEELRWIFHARHRIAIAQLMRRRPDFDSLCKVLEERSAHHAALVADLRACGSPNSAASTEALGERPRQGYGVAPTRPRTAPGGQGGRSSAALGPLRPAPQPAWATAPLYPAAP